MNQNRVGPVAGFSPPAEGESAAESGSAQLSSVASDASHSCPATSGSGSEQMEGERHFYSAVRLLAFRPSEGGEEDDATCSVPASGKGFEKNKEENEKSEEKGKKTKGGTGASLEKDDSSDGSEEHAPLRGFQEDEADFYGGNPFASRNF